MNEFRHGYTNNTRRSGGRLIEKAYSGLDARQRLAREFACLKSLKGRVPVPEVIERDSGSWVLTLREVPGSHGQDMIEAGRAREVLRLLGSLLVQLQQIDPDDVPGLPGGGDVIVHGDYGPQNVLIKDRHVSALLDWEFAHLGQPIEDLAWAEWIVRMHHSDARDALPELFLAAQHEPVWEDRQAAMISRCTELLRRVEQHGPGEAAELWRTRLVLTESWSE